MSLYRFGPAPMGGFPSELEYQWDDFFRRRHFIYAAVGHLPRCNHKDFILWFLSGELPVEIKPASPDHQFVTAAVERANGREDHLLVIEGSPFGYAMWYWWPAADAAQAYPVRWARRRPLGVDPLPLWRQGILAGSHETIRNSLL